MKRTSRAWLAVALGVVVAGALAGAVVAYRADDGGELRSAIDEAEPCAWPTLRRPTARLVRASTCS